MLAALPLVWWLQRDMPRPFQQGLCVRYFQGPLFPTNSIDDGLCLFIYFPTSNCGASLDSLHGSRGAIDGFQAMSEDFRSGRNPKGLNLYIPRRKSSDRRGLTGGSMEGWRPLGPGRFSEALGQSPCYMKEDTFIGT